MMVELWKKSMVNVGGVMVGQSQDTYQEQQKGEKKKKKNANKVKPVM